MLKEADIARRLSDASNRIYPPEAPYCPFPIELLNKSGEEPRPAAVLIPLLVHQGAWHILFTRRTDELPEHSGQVAFPGGRMDPEDETPEATALREAQEEIGLVPSDVRLLGRTDSFITITNYCLTPVVGSIPWPFEQRLAPQEVSRLFTIPIGWLRDPQNYEVREKPLPHPYKPVPVIYYNKYKGELLWGVSAQITLRLLELLFGDTPPQRKS
jgi:8-oxo-dGTP pyrophosphatase MutT (NUDIX family)